MFGQQKRFFIFGQRRTGSTLLVSLLNSHPDIRCYSELFYPGRWNVHIRRFLKPLAFRYPLLYLDGVCRTSFRPIVGFKLMTHQNEELGNLMRQLIERGWRVIAVRRHDIVQRVLSEAVLFTTRKPHSYEMLCTAHYTILSRRRNLLTKSRIILN